MVLILKLPLGECYGSFNLEKAVCNHGFFMMAPNVWIPETKTLQRPLRLNQLYPQLIDGIHAASSVTVSITHHPPSADFLLVEVHGELHLSQSNQQTILEQVCRMLRISDKDEKDMVEFQKLHSDARIGGFGRLFRSPSLFEDCIKSILLCNCTWRRSLKMAEALCNIQCESYDIDGDTVGKKRKRQSVSKLTNATIINDDKGSRAVITDTKVVATGNFPTSKQLASLDEKFLIDKCSLGYRAKHVLKLAVGVESGTIKLDAIEKLSHTGGSIHYNEINKKLTRIKGFGPFVTANVLMCLGFYSKIPADTETIRHLNKVHSQSCTVSTLGDAVKIVYDKYADYKCLAYWWELVNDYEQTFGKLSELPQSKYHTISGSFDLLQSKLDK